MTSAGVVASYFLHKDINKTCFTKKLVELNGRRFYVGNARLNKYLHLAQNTYIAKYGEKLFEESLFAYDNGAVVPEIMENYALLLKKPQSFTALTEQQLDFLDKIYKMLENATLDELIEISHEDEEWVLKNVEKKKLDQEMDSINRIEEYKEQYKDVLTVMERM